MKKVSLIIFVLVVGIPIVGLKMLSSLKAQIYFPRNFINYYFTPKNLGFSTPQTAELAKYVQSNVDYYKGMLDLELPILRYQDSSFDIPITIKYISDGFKPGRRPSLIGNNWSLNVGGVITRNIFGRPDDEKGLNQKAFRDGLLAAIRNGKYRYYSKEELYNLNVAKADPEDKSDIGNLEHDYAPDIFNFSFGGYNGYFLIGNDGKIKSSLGEGFQIDIDKLSVQDHYATEHIPINSTIKITTPNGYTYEFGGDVSYLEYNVPNNPSTVKPSSIQITSWYLKSIHSVNNNIVYFKYKKYIQRNEYKNFTMFDSNLLIETDVFIRGYPIKQKDGLTDCHTLKDYLETPIIDEIIINDAHIKFKIGTFNKSFYNEGNYDLLYLDEIIESYGNTHKSISFEYLQNGNYFFLHHLKKNSQAINPDIYSFEYNLSTTLPDSRTIAIDHWGYWNGGYTIEEDTKTYLYNIDNRKAVNTNVADITMLTRIIFPTKGETRITYEPNYYNHWEVKNMERKLEWKKAYSPTPIPCGGVRVKNINDHDPVSQKDIVRTYRYVSQDGKGSGVIGILPKYRSDEETEQRTPYHYINGYYASLIITGIHTSISSNTIGRLYNISEHHIGYSDVIEQYSDESKISYHYSSRIDVPDDESINGRADARPDIQTFFDTENKRLEKCGLYNPNDMSEYRGKLLSKITYSKKQEMLLMQLYTYNTDEWRNNYEVSISNAYLALVANRIYYTPCHVVKEVQADINGVEIHKMYSYNTKNLVSEERIVQSNKDTLQLSYIYPFENTTAIAKTNYLSDLIRINKISEPIVTTKSVQRNKKNGNQLLSAVKYNFGKFNNQYLKSTLSEWSIDNFASNEYSLENGDFTIKEQYLNYDDYGNITCLIDKNKDTTVYIWSYKGRFPIAEIKGATYEQVKSALRLSPESLSHDSTPDLNQINALRIKLPKASINTYTYSPLNGLITSTNPQGIMTYFEYDSAGRLKTVNDNYQNIIKKYYYKNFNQSFEDDPKNDYYCKVTFDASAYGGDGTIKTVRMKCGEQLPTPTPSKIAFLFEGWYDGDVKITNVPNSPSITVKGKFVLNRLVIYVTLMNEHLDERDCANIGFLTAPFNYNGEIPDYVIDNTEGVKTYTIYRAEGDAYPPTFIQANSYSDNKFLGWYRQNKDLYSIDNQLTDMEMDRELEFGEHIYAAFSNRQNTSDKKYTIKISSRSNTAGSGGVIGFESGKLQRASQEITVNEGTTITIYAEGDRGNNDSDYGQQPWWYYIKGFYTGNNTALKTYNDINKTTAQYTFTVRSNRTIYIDFVYHKR